MMPRAMRLLLIMLVLAGCAAPEYDVVLRGGTIYDGAGGAPITGDVAIVGDSIVAVGDIGDGEGETELDVTGLAVAPGFINMLSWATTSLIEDPRSMSDIVQGVTLEVFGEGTSEGPVSPEMKAEVEELQGDIKYEVEWTTLGEYLEYLEQKGVSTNVASFIGVKIGRAHV